MRIANLTMCNWMPYAGFQTLALEAKAYSVVARQAGDPDRSNWGGKTAFLQAPYFALYGEHTARTEDGWITEGAKEGTVALLLTDGHDHIHVDRTRKRGKSTQLTVKHAKDAREIGSYVEMKGDEAQAFLNQRLGLTAADFGATCYFAQRQMARMVLAKPQDRMDIVGAWLRLEPLIKAEEHVRKELADLSVEMDVIRQNLNTAQRMLDVELGNHDDSAGVVPVPTTLEALLAALTVKEAQLGELQKQKDEVGQRVQEARRLAVARSRVAEYERIVEAGTKVKADLESMDLKALVAAEEEAQKLERDMAVLVGQYERDLQQKRKVALGQFDGVCPVAGIDCPATDTINKKSKASRDAFAIAETTLKNGRSEYNILTDQHEQAKRERTTAEALKIRLGALRDQVRALKDDYELAKCNAAIYDTEALEADYTQVCNRVVNHAGELAAERAGLQRAERALADKAKYEEKRKALEAVMAVKREAVIVFGKLGAQKRVAELALRSIEDGANDMLRECAIDLSVEVQWSREGQGLAKTCDACGHPFSVSAKVKACERCGAARGPLLVNKLDLVLSDRSGAAEDLAGASIQLSASAWLREERGSAWSTALIDEPFGQLDASNRRAFASHLTAMLSGRYGFGQAFVVSHSPDTTEMLPGKIVVERADGRSVARVLV